VYIKTRVEAIAFPFYVFLKKVVDATKKARIVPLP